MYQHRPRTDRPPARLAPIIRLSQEVREYVKLKLWSRHPPLPESDGDSMITLVDQPIKPEERTGKLPAIAFLCLVLSHSVWPRQRWSSTR